MSTQKVKNYSAMRATIKKDIRKLTWGKIVVEETAQKDQMGHLYEFYTKPRAFRGTYGFYCLWYIYDFGFIYLSFIYRGKKRWYDPLKRFIPSKRRVLEYSKSSGVSVPASFEPQKKCKEYNMLSKKMKVTFNSQHNTVHLSVGQYVSDKKELKETIKTILSILCDAETKSFIQGLGV